MAALRGEDEDALRASLGARQEKECALHETSRPGGSYWFSCFLFFVCFSGFAFLMKKSRVLEIPPVRSLGSRDES